MNSGERKKKLFVVQFAMD